MKTRVVTVVLPLRKPPLRNFFFQKLVINTIEGVSCRIVSSFANRKISQLNLKDAGDFTTRRVIFRFTFRSFLSTLRSFF